MATYLDMVTRCASELHRTDLNNQIKAAILSAIAFYSANRFYGNEAKATITTIPGQRYYGTDTVAPGTLPTGINEIDSVTTLVQNRTYQLDETSYDNLEAIDAGVTPLSGYPRLWAWYAGQIRVYPAPNAAYTLTLSYQKTLTTLSADGDSNFWTNEAEELIRSRAKKDVAANFMWDEALATRCAVFERDALKSLKAETTKLIGSGKLTSTPF